MLQISPRKASVTEKLKISGCGFEPFAPVTIHATLDVPSVKLHLHSYAHITTSSEGSFDLQNTEPSGGSYLGVDSMGLFWEMEKSNDYFTRTSISQMLLWSLNTSLMFIKDT